MNRPATHPKLELPDVTLCCIDTRSVDQALHAIQQSTALASFGRLLFLGPQPQGDQADRVDGLDWHVIPALRGIADYNRLVLRDLAAHVHTPYALIIQWDGFVTTPALWQDDYLTVDYIGSPWYHGGHPGMVGNGGFSLRSKRLLDALAGMDLDWQEPEDAVICVHKRAELETRHGIRFAPLEMAQSFGCEYGTYRPSFGFHGMHNFAQVMDRSQLDAWLSQVPSDILVHKHARKLVKALIQTRRIDEAVQLVRQRSQTLGWTADQLTLYLRAQLRRLT